MSVKRLVPLNTTELPSNPVSGRAGDIYLPKVNSAEALSLMAQDFVDSIINNTVPKSDAKIGLDVVKILEAAQKSIKNKGQEIKIEQ